MRKKYLLCARACGMRRSFRFLLSLGSQTIVKLLQERTAEVDSKARFLNAAVVILNVTFEPPFQEPRVQRPFYARPNEPQSIESMSTLGKFGYKELPDHGFRVLALPLLSGNLSFLVLMSMPGVSLKSVRAVLVKQPELLLNMHGQLRQTSVKVTLPRFKVSLVSSHGRPLGAMYTRI